MQLKLAKTLWGVAEAGEPGSWDSLFSRIKAEGFDAVEAIPLTWRLDAPLFKSLLAKHSLSLICQIHTSGEVGGSGEYVYMGSNKVHDHLASFVKLTGEAKALGAKVRQLQERAEASGAGDPTAVTRLRHEVSDLRSAAAVAQEDLDGSQLADKIGEIVEIEVQRDEAHSKIKCRVDAHGE